MYLLNKNKINHPISSNSHPSATANKANWFSLSWNGRNGIKKATLRLVLYHRFKIPRILYVAKV